MSRVASPVLLVAFRRPDLTARVLASLRDARPSRLYVAIDGPRHGVEGEADQVTAVKRVVADGVDWPCEVFWRIRTENLGCRRGVVDAIDWFFAEEAEGIILEDDCVPAPEFYEFCDELLERYRDDQRVFSIGGDNAGGVILSGPWSYGFVRHPAVWGWATWRRAWQRYDRDMALWRSVRGTPLVDSIFADPLEREYRSRVFDRLVDRGVPDTWDYQWSATCFLNGGLTVMPRENLVANVGFRDDATHTTSSSPLADAPVGTVMPLQHPPLIVADRPAEAQVLRLVDGIRDGLAERGWRRIFRLRA